MQEKKIHTPGEQGEQGSAQQQKRARSWNKLQGSGFLSGVQRAACHCCVMWLKARSESLQ